MAKIRKFGTFGGVFIPSILTILGVIMYMRLPMIVGEAGLWVTLGIIVVAHIISITTGLSISSMATDKKVEAGGPYYIISRSLGLPIGGTLGLALFVGLSFSISLYLIGFSESFLAYMRWDTGIDNIRISGSIALLVLITITFISTSLAIRAQYFIMIAIVLSIFSIFWGNHDLAPVAPLFSGSGSSISLMVLFGIFFPAVTGFSAGVSMSGDLEDPKRSIPIGTIAAVAVGFIIYVGLTVFFALTIKRDALINDPLVLLNIALLPELVVAGIWGATLSSALGSILGAPRILQAISADKISPQFFAKGYGPTKEPRNAVLLVFLIAEAGILIGELDVIARIVSIFFITTYGFLNISAAFEKWTSTDYLPEFKVPGWVSMMGALACLVVMIQLDFVAMLGAILMLGLVYFLLKRKELTLDSGDAWSGVWAALVKTGLTNLVKDKVSQRNWRPNLIMFSGNPNTRAHMVEIGKAIAGKLGILSAFELVKSDDKILAKTQSDLEKDKDAIGYFRHKLHCRDVYSGMDQIARVYGFSGVEPNTVLMGWSHQPTNRDYFIALLENFKQNGFNTIFLNYNAEKSYGQYKKIDFWWSGADRNLGLAINIIRHITNSPKWKSANIRILIPNTDATQIESIFKSTVSILDSYRLDAEVKILAVDSPKLNRELVLSQSEKADLIVIGVRESEFSQLDRHYDHINHMLSGIGSSLIINASSDFEEVVVIDDRKSKLQSFKEESTETPWELPSLAPSIYPEITQGINLLDANGLEVLELFFEKTFRPIFQDHQLMISDLSDKIGVIRKELIKVKEHSETFKKRKEIDKLKSDTLYGLNTLISEEFKEKNVKVHAEQIESGIGWYLERLDSDFKKLPAKLKITYPDNVFDLDQKDAFQLKCYKRWKKVKHFILGGSVTQNINYKKFAKYYQLHARIEFINHLTEKFQQDENRFYSKIKGVTTSIIKGLDTIEGKVWDADGTWDDLAFADLESLLDAVISERKETSELYHHRLLGEFRRNLKLMTLDMEQIEADSRVKQKSKAIKNNNLAREQALSFAEAYQLRIRTSLNMIGIELAVHSTKKRQEILLDDFIGQLKQSVKNNYIKSIDSLVKKVDPTTLEKVKFKMDFEPEFQEAYDQHIIKLIQLTENMPETLEVQSLLEQSGGEDTVAIPVSKMAEYHLKTRYESSMDEAFSKLMESLRRSIYSAQDIVNLSIFNLVNREDNMEVKPDQVIEDCKLKLSKEGKIVQQLLTEFELEAFSYLQEAVEPLDPIKIEESANDFLTSFRAYQGKKVLTGAGALANKGYRALEKVIITLFYGRSETILFAKKLNKENEFQSSNSQLLDLLEELNPNSEIVRKLPHYYITLFSGRSSISKDLWVERPHEEKLFKKAITRYRSGFAGGILIIGERNAGKTAFCKKLVQDSFKTNDVYSIFPPVRGTTNVDIFDQILGKVTQQRGDATQILTMVKEESVVIINDLELFWEGTDDGMQVINHIISLLDDFSHKIIFIVNTNPYAYKLIEEKTHINGRFLELINMSPFDAGELKELIMKRHRSSGIDLTFKKEGGVLNELRTASLFNSYFNYSKGNPGAALHGWLACIKKSDKSAITIEKPIIPGLIPLKQLNQEWVKLLTQFVLHKRLTHEKIQHVTSWEDDKIKNTLLEMSRSGVIVEKTTEVYQIHPYLHPFIVSVLKEKEEI